MTEQTNDLPAALLLSPREVMTEWVEALESGEYAQTKGYLKLIEGNDNDEPAGLCCLGVLCELAVKHGLIEPGVDVHEFGEIGYLAPGETPEGTDGKFAEWQYERTIPPAAVTKWAGLEDPSAIVTHERYDWDLEEEVMITERVDLVGLNDTEGYTFEQIAAALRETYLV